jgi:hypothetical protein
VWLQMLTVDVDQHIGFRGWFFPRVGLLTWVIKGGVATGMGGGTTRSVTYFGTQLGFRGPRGTTCCKLARPLSSCIAD